jgi:GntR family transcriptional regulator of vanillate catabolism
VPSPGSSARRHRLLTHAHHQHHAVAEAILGGQGSRAEALMREHARNARTNLRLILEAGDAAPPGFRALVSGRIAAA